MCRGGNIVSILETFVFPTHVHRAVSLNFNVIGNRELFYRKTAANCARVNMRVIFI